MLYLSIYHTFLKATLKLISNMSVEEKIPLLDPTKNSSSFILIINFVLFSLKLECEKLVQEKTEMQRHYVMVRRY